MKKTLGLIFLTIALSVTLFSCEFVESQHNHKYSKTWNTTETEHWRQASCEHTDLIVNRGEHTFDEGVTTKNPTEDAEGVKTFTCTVCKYEKTEPIVRLPHTHKYDMENWAYNNDYHWREPICGHVGAAELSAHRMNGNDCWDCDYMAESQGLAYRMLSDGTYEVTGRGSCTDSNVVIPEKYNKIAVTSIGAGAFAGEQNITTKVVIPETVKYIGAGAFRMADGLREVIFKGESSLISIGEYAFYGCYSQLKSFTVPKSVTEIGDGAFHFCKKLENFVVEDGNTAFKVVDGNLYTSDTSKLIQYAVANTKTEFTVPEGVKTIGVGAFAYSPYLEKITFNADCTMTELPAEAFYFSQALKEITIPASVTALGARAFSKCEKLEVLNIPDGLKTISDETFYNCYVLPEFEIPSGVTSIGDYAFAYCHQFTKFYFPSGVTKLGTGVVSGCEKLVEVKIPASVTKYGTNMFYGAMMLQSVEVDSGNTKLMSLDGHLYTKNGKNLIYYAVANPATEFTVPENVTTIKASAFYGCKNLVNVTLQSNIRTIESNAFMQCSKLESINLPEGLTSVGEAAFLNCVSLKEIAFPSTLKTIPGDMLCGCNALRTLVIPATITEIGRDAFAYLDLETVVFENTAGWTCHYENEGKPATVSISEEDLKDSEKAALFITRGYQGNKYYSYVWKWTQP